MLYINKPVTMSNVHDVAMVTGPITNSKQTYFSQMHIMLVNQGMSYSIKYI